MVNSSHRILVPRMPTFEQIGNYLRKIDESKIYSNFGPLNTELVNRLADYFGVANQNVCTVANATLGLQAVIQNCGITPTEPIQVPSFTFAASPMSILASGYECEFIDIDEELRAIPGSDAQIVMDVLPFGASLRDPDWYNNLDFLVIDAAASFDALHNFAGRHKLPNRSAIVVSLHSTKLIGAGEGGVIISPDVELISRIKCWQNFGFANQVNTSRESMFVGTNAKMSEYACAVCLASLDLWPETKSVYLELNSRAMAINLDLQLTPHNAMRDGFATPYWGVFHLEPEEIAKIESTFAENGYETRRWWSTGCHNMPAFEQSRKLSLPTTERVARRYLGLPFHSFLNEEYWDRAHEMLSVSLN